MYKRDKYFHSNAAEIAARAARAAYMRKWRSENKDKVRVINQNYWIRRAEREEAQRTAANNQEA